MTEEEKASALNDPEKWYGESNDSMKNRAVEFYKEIVGSEKNIIVVSHGGIWRHIHRFKYNIPDNQAITTPPNCEILEI